MKKNWSDPELKNLSISCTNEGVECSVTSPIETLDGNHWVGKECHHKLIINGKPANAFTCGYAQHATDNCKPVIKCLYTSAS